MKMVRMENSESEEELWDDEIKAEAGRDATDKPPVRWIAYHTILFWIIGPLALVIFFGGLSIGIPQNILNFALMFPIIILGAITGISSLFSYYEDSKRLKEDDDDDSWTPFWPIWILASILIGSPIIAPLYLLTRRLSVGPADYSGSWFDVIK